MASVTSMASGANSNHEQSLNALLQRVGFVAEKSLATTLQGQIWSIKEKKTGQHHILKIASRRLHDKKLSHFSVSDCDSPLSNVTIHEDIVKEASVMKYICSLPAVPASIIGYRGFLESNKNYYLIMQHGGSALFDFIARAHKLLALNKLDIDQWLPVVHAIFKQLVDAVDFLHAHRVTHSDISLENMTIANHIHIAVHHQGTPNERVKFVNLAKDIQIKLIDFGVAEKFASSNANDHHLNDECKSSQHGKASPFASTKFCGKRNYQSPEIVRREVFDAAANDVWCMGICLFMMVAGSGPWNVASVSDAAYELVMKGHLKPLLQHWGKLAYFDADLLDLITGILQPESKRVSVAEIKAHAWYTQTMKTPNKT